jgi:UPF0755 protein
VRSRTFRRLLLLAILLGGGALAALLAWVRLPYRGYSGNSASVEFPIGTSTHQIFVEMARAGLVRNAPAAELYFRLVRRGSILRAGEYSFTGSETLDAIVNRIAAGEVVRHIVVLPEGLTNEEVFALFLAQRIGTLRGFRRSASAIDLFFAADATFPDLEGFLFPDTYVATRSTPTREIVQAMVRNFERHDSPGWRQKASVLGLSLRQAVTLASLVEKESALAAERPHVAAVYLNRLRIGMRLQCDPTVIYALERSGQWRGRLQHGDLDFESPYNTYLRAGLPPGPICNPGAASLAAAVEPAASPDLYFVARGDGGHYFSRTYDEHLAMIARSRAAAASPPR